MPDEPNQGDGSAAFTRAYGLYWAELIQLKVETIYIAKYRDRLSARLSWFAIGRAVVSVGALGSWFSGVGHPELWAGVIVVSQTGEAIVSALPLAAREKQLSAFALDLDSMLIDGLLEWESMQSGAVGAGDISNRRHRLMRLRHEAEVKHLPGGLPLKRKLFALAEQEAGDYFKSVYGLEPLRRGR